MMLTVETKTSRYKDKAPPQMIEGRVILARIMGIVGGGSVGNNSCVNVDKAS